MQQLQIGDKIKTRGRIGVVWHYGVYVGPQGPNGEDVVHNSKVLGRVVLEHFQTFSGGAEVFIELHAAPGCEWHVAQRALSYLGQNYDLLSFNCEQFASLAQEGVKRSPQLQTGMGTVGFLTILAAAALWPPSTYYDRNVDRRREKGSGRFARG